ncbi:MAG: CoA transferase [Dehalococcoidia bacterium]
MTAFEGARVLDFTQGIAGPLATQLLADFGADVVKVEPPAGDRMRDQPVYLTLNRNKRVITLDLARYEGLREARRLIASADAAVFDSAPGELERLGLDATSALAANPTLLHAWLPPYGRHGRWSQLPPDDALLQAVSGVSFCQSRYNQDQPVFLTTPQCTYGHGLMAATAIAAGLYERHRTGRGRAISVSGLEGVAAVHSFAFVRTPDVIRMAGRDSRGGVPNYRLYQCKDGLWIFLATLSPAFFINALTVMDQLEILTMDGIDGEYTHLFLPENSVRAIARLDEAFAQKDRPEWEALFVEHAIPHGPVGDRDSWYAGETVAANHMRIELEHEKLGKVAIPGVPVDLAETPGSVRHLATAAKPAEIAWERVSAATPLDEHTDLPLRGLKVLDLAQVIAGAYVSTILANLGAEVVKVESPSGDIFRPSALAFIATNRGKRGAVLDMKQPAGLAAFLDLVRGADVVVDNFRLGVRDRLGIDYAALSAVNARVITASITGYGPRGPLAPLPGFDPILQARGGLMKAQGGADEPVFYTLPINDTGAALTAAFGICAALLVRERTGRGQEIQTSLANSSITCQSAELAWHEGRPPNPIGSTDCIGVAALRRFYLCSDGWVVLACSLPEHFHQLCTALGHTEWAARTIAERALDEPRDGVLAGAIAAALESMESADVVDRLLARGVPAARVSSRPELYEDPWMQENAMFDHHTHRLFPDITSVRGVAAWGAELARWERTAPMLGEHTVEVLRDFGLEDGAIELLLAGGAAVQGE